MMHGIDFSLSPGSVVLQAGNTNQIGEDDKGLCGYIFNRKSAGDYRCQRSALCLFWSG